MDYTRLIVRLLFDAGHFSKAQQVQRTGKVVPEDRDLVDAILTGRGYGHATDQYPVAGKEDDER